MEEKKFKLRGRYWSFNSKEDDTVDMGLYGIRYEDLELDFNKTAFILVDVYGEGFDEGDPIPKNSSMGAVDLFFIEKEIINKKINPALDMARKKNFKIIYIENKSDPYLMDENSEYGKYTKRIWGVSVGELFGGDEGLLKYSKAISPKKGEFIVQKRFYGAFTNTELNYLLQNLNIKNLITVGFAADVCLFFTLYEAWTHNYKVILIRDATLGVEITKNGLKKLSETKHAVKFVERFIGHTITTREFIESCKVL